MEPLLDFSVNAAPARLMVPSANDPLFQYDTGDVPLAAIFKVDAVFELLLRVTPAPPTDRVPAEIAAVGAALWVMKLPELFNETAPVPALTTLLIWRLPTLSRLMAPLPTVTPETEPTVPTVNEDAPL